MANVFGFTEEELKLLLVAVRQMRRMFTQAQKQGAGAQLAAYAEMYERLFEKLTDMAGPVPEELKKVL